MGDKAGNPITAHKSGWVSALNYNNGMLYSGGADGSVCLIDVKNGWAVVKCVNVGAVVRGVDGMGGVNGKFIAGLKNGKIVECNLSQNQ